MSEGQVRACHPRYHSKTFFFFVSHISVNGPIRFVMCFSSRCFLSKIDHFLRLSNVDTRGNSSWREALHQASDA